MIWPSFRPIVKLEQTFHFVNNHPESPILANRKLQSRSLKRVLPIFHQIESNQAILIKTRENDLDIPDLLVNSRDRDKRFILSPGHTFLSRN